MRRLAIAALLCFLATSALAQSPEDLTQFQMVKRNNPLNDATLDSPFVGDFEALKIEGGKDDKNATGMISFGNNVLHTLHVKVTAPLDKSSDTQKIADLTGLPGTAKLETGFNYRLTEPKLVVNDREGWKKHCKDNGQQETCNIFQFGNDVASKFVDVQGMTTALAAAFEFTRAKFDYVDATTLAPGSEKHPQYSATVSYGMVPNTGPLYFVGFGYTLQQSWEAKKKQNLCRPVTGTDALRCTEVSVGAPEEKDKRVFEVRSRWFSRDDFAFDVVLQHDFEGDAQSIELPLSFIRGKDNLFNGGIVFGWRSDENEFTASFFIGAMKKIL